MLLKKYVYFPAVGYEIGWDREHPNYYRPFLGGWFWKEFDDGVEFTTA